MRAPDRDQKETERADAEITRFLTLYPDNELVPMVKQFQDEVRENLAQMNLWVGDYYAKLGNQNGASSRYKEIQDKYPHYSKGDEVDFKLAQAYLQMAAVLKQLENTTEAASYEKQAIENLNKVAAGYPFSKFYDEAKAELVRLGKPVPAVDSELAARNQALLKQPPPFSPLRPFIDLANAMGFIPTPNRYDQAKKALEQSKAAAAAAAAAAGSTDTKPGDPKINLGTIEKGADGKPAANAKVTTANTDKKDDKKVDPKSVKKK
jgi:tetratricopeptide (TPR) repeat protein